MIIGISGKIGSGKSTVAKMIREFTEAPFEEKMFAFKLKKTASMLTGIEMAGSDFTQEQKAQFLPEWEMTLREILQKLGTEAVRDGLHEQAWVLALFADYKEQSNWIITDCRFPNEVEAIKKRGGIVVRIERPINPFPKSTHPSETSLDEYYFDYIIENHGDVENDLASEVGEMLKYFNIIRLK